MSAQKTTTIAKCVDLHFVTIRHALLAPALHRLFLVVSTSAIDCLTNQIQFALLNQLFRALITTTAAFDANVLKDYC